MSERQGYLDGEDQKTLISFVLYGDPLFSLSRSRQIPTGKGISRTLVRPQTLKTGCALGGPDLLSGDPDRIGSDSLRAIVAKYLPNMVDADCRMRAEHWGCADPDHCCPTQQLGSKSVGKHEVYVLTLGKRMAGGNQLHPKFARLTMDKSGKLLKLAVSR
jgi:hypothetical protein